jgi:two-component system response regulator AtoC
MSRPPAASPQVLLVEDDPTFRASLALLARSAGYQVREAGDLASAREVLQEGSIDLVVLDLDLPDGNGLDLKLNASIDPDTPFIVVSGDVRERAKATALLRGAADFLCKPLEATRFEAVLHAARAGRPLRAQLADLRASLREAGRFGHLVGRSAPMQRVYDLIARVSTTAVPVLVLGESGSGKELVAHTIHDMSPRQAAPFVAVNCGAIPETLIESKLFGHEKGAFTGAETRQLGVFEQADNGTLFLDEIGEMPPELQVRLLRVLETSTFERIGGRESILVDVRIVAATNREPREAIAAGRLREDLFHRLNVFPVRIPPLRERTEDIELLARHFLDGMNAAEGTRKRLGPDALALLEGAPWTGNVRELRNAVQRAWILADEQIGALEVGGEAERGGPPPAPTPSDAAAGAGSEQVGSEAGVFVRVGTTVAGAERALIEATLRACEGNKRKAAGVLGISVRTLYSRLETYARERDADES